MEGYSDEVGAQAVGGGRAAKTVGKSGFVSHTKHTTEETNMDLFLS